MYIRVKNRKNKSGHESSYAYLVVAKHRKKHPKQKVKLYLGRVFKLEKRENNEEELKIDFKKNLKAIFSDFVRITIIECGFKEIEENKLKKEKIIVDLNNLIVYNEETGKKICLKINEGFICDLTLKKLVLFKPPEAIEREIGKSLAKMLLEAGIAIKSDSFVALFQKVMQTCTHAITSQAQNKHMST